jgi:predicted nucleotidyltransferase
MMLTAGLLSAFVPPIAELEGAALLGANSGLIGVSQAEAAALARQIFGIEVDGQSAVSSVMAFGSRAGSTFRGAATGGSDLDVLITITAPEQFGAVQSEMKDIQFLFEATKGFPLEPTYVIPGLPRPVLLKTPFIPLKP